MIEHNRELWVLRDVDERGVVAARHAFWVASLIAQDFIAYHGEEYVGELFLTESGAAELDWWNDHPRDERTLASEAAAERMMAAEAAAQRMIDD